MSAIATIEMLDDFEIDAVYGGMDKIAVAGGIALVIVGAAFIAYAAPIAAVTALTVGDATFLGLISSTLGSVAVGSGL